jgi:hypothetical protein
MSVMRPVKAFRRTQRKSPAEAGLKVIYCARVGTNATHGLNVANQLGRFKASSQLTLGIGIIVVGLVYLISRR